jgi:hypothetical protein
MKGDQRGNRKRRRSMTRLVVSVSLVTLLFTLNPSGADAQNVGQVGLAPGPECSTGGVVSDVPGLTLSLDTAGGPVLVIYTVQFNGNPNAGVTLWLVIDGVTETSGQRDRFIGTAGQVADVTFSRVYAVANGQHTFGLRATCQSQVVFATGWLTVYELPKSKKKRDK